MVIALSAANRASCLYEPLMEKMIGINGIRLRSGLEFAAAGAAAER